MRRPIFGNGIPRRLTGADGSVEVFDTEDLDEGQVYALTLYLWFFRSGSGVAFSNPSLLLAVSTQGEPFEVIGVFDASYLDTIWNPAGVPTVADTVLAPVKVLDRYMLRGEQRVFAANTAADAATFCFLWGFFEQVGDDENGRPFRGLQPTNLVPPTFSYPPVFLSATPNLSLQETLHQLSPQYIDRLTLDVSTVSDDPVLPSVVFPGGVTVELPSNNGFGVPIRMFDGIPMRAPSAVDVSITAKLVTGAAQDATLFGYGSFDRY